MWRKVWIGAVLAGLALAAVCCALPLKPIRGTLLVDRGHRLSRGLVGCWLLNEGGGNVVLDLVSRAQGVIQSGVSWVPGKDGPALYCSGYQNVINFGNWKGLLGATECTIIIWAKSNEAANVTGTDAILHKQGTANDTFWLVWSQSDTMVYDAGDSIDPAFPSYQANSSATVVDFDRWHQVIASSRPDGYNYVAVDGGAKSGVSAATRSGALVDTAHDMLCAWNGWVDSILVWNRALTTAEIAELYHDPFAMFRRVPVEYYVSAPAAPPAGGGRHQVIIIAKAALPACIPLGIVASMTFMMWCERRRAT